MNENTRNTFASYGLEILKRSVLLVLYDSTDVYYDDIPPSPYGDERLLKAWQIRQRLGIPKLQYVSANENSLIYGILNLLYDEGLAYHYLSRGWAITEKGVSVIEG